MGPGMYYVYSLLLDPRYAVLNDSIQSRIIQMPKTSDATNRFIKEFGVVRLP